MYISRAPLELNLIEKVTRLPTWNAANKNGAYLNCQIRTSFMYARYIPYFKKEHTHLNALFCVKCSLSYGNSSYRNRQQKRDF